MGQMAMPATVATGLNVMGRSANDAWQQIIWDVHKQVIF
jgi:hypothetical protein